MTKESDILDAFENIHQACLTEIDPNLTLKECVVTFMVLKERYRTFKYLIDTPNAVFDVNDKYVHLDGYQREIAIEHWPLGEHYFNNPEPMWDTLMRTFADLSLNNYPDEEFWKRHSDFTTFDQLIADYWAEEARQTARRRRRSKIKTILAALFD
ncbi:leucine carboxyl methyltransferase 1 [Striga asiatica]|uniref:Leucine carboxyl methyltransferase 1 n=1 Tax=Striga asiatica TaxID=4170 RepID=A0A5A7QI15_STRAF|nr:leucine carboxyl methyltransferase 1 [Striga asiatica]